MLASPGVVHRPKLGQPISSNGRRLHVESRKRRVWQRKRIPIRPDINTSTAALAADNPAFEVRNFSLSRVAPHFDRRGLAAGIVQARRDQPLTPARACCRAHVTDAVEGWLIPGRIPFGLPPLARECCDYRPGCIGPGSGRGDVIRGSQFLFNTSLASCGSRWGPMTC